MFQIELIEKCKQNHRPSQLKLYEQYCDAMLIVAKRFVKDVMEAEDIVQEAFVGFLNSLPNLKAKMKNDKSRGICHWLLVIGHW